MGTILWILGTIIVGAIIGILGRWVVPGRQSMPFWLTIVVGIVAVWIGQGIATFFGVGATNGIDWLRWIITIIVCAVLVVLTANIYGRSKGRAS